MPFQWRNQLWHSLEEDCTFNGVTNYDRVWKKCAGKRGLECGTSGIRGGEGKKMVARLHLSRNLCRKKVMAACVRAAHGCGTPDPAWSALRVLRPSLAR